MAALVSSMEQEQKRLPEQQRYVDSFAEAMRSVEAEMKRRNRYNKAYLELQRMGAWDAEWMSHSFVLVVGKLSPLSSRLRGFILQIGGLAKEIYDRA